MERDDSAGPREPHHLGEDLLRLRHVDQHQPRRREIERPVGKPGAAAVRAQNLDVREVTRGDELPRALHLLRAPLHADHAARRADALREETKTPLRAAADLDHAPTVAHADLVEESRRLVRELLGLSLEAFLLRSPIAQQVRVGCSHPENVLGMPSKRALSPQKHECHAGEPHGVRERREAR